LTLLGHRAAGTLIRFTSRVGSFATKIVS